MLKLSEIKGERALEVIAEIIDPVSDLVKDKGFKAVCDTGDKLGVVKYLLKNHGKNVLKILALINDEDPDTYEPTIIQLPKMVLELFEDPDITELFGLQDRTTVLASTDLATENIEALKK